jgi:hypothetical protein
VIPSFSLAIDQVRSDGMAQRALPEKYHLLQAFIIDRAHEPLNMRRQIRGSRWQTHWVDPFMLRQVPEISAELAVSVHQQVANASRKAVAAVVEIPGDLQNQLGDLRRGRRPPWFLPAPIAVVPLLGNQATVNISEPVSPASRGLRDRDASTAR